MPKQIAARRFQWKNKKKFAITGSGGVLSLTVGYYLGYFALGFILAMILFYKSNIYLQKANTWRLGAEGEEKVARELEKLEKHTVFNDISLYESLGEKSNIDHLVIGRNGAFLIETKNHRGTISCNGDEWVQEKVGTLGTRYLGGLKNPSRQAKRNAASLREFLEKNTDDLRIWVNAVIVFTNEEAQLNISNPTVTVLRAEGLNDFIMNFKSQKRYSQGEVEKLSEIINRM